MILFKLFNWLGLGICAVAFAGAFGIASLAGTTDDQVVLAIAGPIIATLDLLFRGIYGARHWLRPSKGGHLFFIPVWAFGLLWLVLGVVRSVAGD